MMSEGALVLPSLCNFNFLIKGDILKESFFVFVVTSLALHHSDFVSKFKLDII